MDEDATGPVCLMYPFGAGNCKIINPKDAKAVKITCTTPLCNPNVWDGCRSSTGESTAYCSLSYEFFYWQGWNGWDWDGPWDGGTLELSDDQLNERSVITGMNHIGSRWVRITTFPII